jgi:hypothetical protein
MRGRHLPPELQGEEAGLHTGKEGVTSHCTSFLFQVPVGSQSFLPPRGQPFRKISEKCRLIF